MHWKILAVLFIEKVYKIIGRKFVTSIIDRNQYSKHINNKPRYIYICMYCCCPQ